MLPLMGISQNDKNLNVTTDTFVLNLLTDSFPYNGFELQDTLSFIKELKIHTFDLYETIPCKLYTSYTENPIEVQAIVKTIYTKIGESGDWIAGNRVFLHVIDSQGLVLDIDLKSTVIVQDK